jgi:N-acetylglucosaminyldiphosphoundecaprenol N-acetyl-beta-D-mannosaminyltransferase
MVSFINYPIFEKSFFDLLHIVKNAIETDKTILINPLNSYIFVLTRTNPKLDSCFLNSTFITADGISVVKGIKFLSNKEVTRITGVDLMYSLIDMAIENNYSIYFWGSTDSTLKKIANILHNKNYFNITGFSNGFSDFGNADEIIKKIETKKPNIIFLGMNTPQKEYLSVKLKEKGIANIILSVGGSFEVFVGNKKRAPIFLQKLGLEWLFRLIQEPIRLGKRYLITNIKFIYLLIAEKIKSKKD